MEDNKNNLNNNNESPETSDIIETSSHIVEDKKENTATVKNKKRKKKASFKDKLLELWSDKRPFKKRLIPAIFVSFAFTYTLFFFGVFEMFVPQADFLPFTMDDLLMPTILVGIAIFAGLVIILSLLRGKIYNYITTAFFSATLCSYIQCNFMNKLSALDGSRYAWETMVSQMLINLVIWAVLFLIPYIVLYFNKKFWRKAVTLISALLILIQTVGLVYVFATSTRSVDKSDMYLSNSTIYEVSDKKNTIVFLIDRCAFDTLESVFKKYPDIKENLTGFTNYSNVAGSYTRTYPSVAYFLTGVEYDYDMPIYDNMSKMWSEGTFLPRMKEAGINTKVYSEPSYMLLDIRNAVGRIDNLGNNVVKPNTGDMLASMYSLSMYRYSPLTMKPFFWCYTGDIGAGETDDSGVLTTDVHGTNDPAFFAGLRKNGISLTDEGNGSFIFYHMRGAHDPWVMDENGNNAGTTDEYRQTAGNMRMILEYIDQLKENGVYDDTTIIITADHGKTGNLKELDTYRSISLLIKPAGEESNDAMKYNKAPLNHRNIQAYILKSLGLEYSDYGAAVDEVAEDAKVTRYFYMSAANIETWITGQTKRDTDIVTYKIEGDIRDFDNWSIVERKPIKYPFYDSGFEVFT